MIFDPTMQKVRSPKTLDVTNVISTTQETLTCTISALDSSAARFNGEFDNGSVSCWVCVSVGGGIRGDLQD